MTVGVGSGNVPSDDLLIQIKVPKIIRRKRKRNPGPVLDSLDPEARDENEQQQTATDRNPRRLLQSMSDNPSRYEVSVLGHVNHVHRFRGKAIFHTEHNHLLMLLGRYARLRLLYREPKLYDQSSRYDSPNGL